VNSLPPALPTVSRRKARIALAVGGALAVAAVCIVFVPGQSHMMAAADVPTPAFVQQVSAHKLNVVSLAATPGAALGNGNRLIVEVGVWNSANATAKTVTAAAGDTFTEISHFAAADGTEQSVWTAPISSGSGTKPAVTATATSKADIGIGVLEYSGLSILGGSASVDVQTHAVGLTGGATATTVSSGATSPVGSANEMAIGFYSDSGFGNALTAGDGFNKRVGVAPANDMELLVEDRLTMAGDVMNAGVGTGKNTNWEMNTIVFKTAAFATPAVPSAPAGVTGNPGSGSVNVAWTAPADGGSPITSYTVTPYIGSAAQPSVNIVAPATGTTISGLANGTAYTFTVAAINAIGSGPASAPSMAVTLVRHRPGSGRHWRHRRSSRFTTCCCRMASSWCSTVGSNHSRRTSSTR